MKLKCNEHALIRLESVLFTITLCDNNNIVMELVTILEYIHYILLHFCC